VQKPGGIIEKELRKSFSAAYKLSAYKEKPEKIGNVVVEIAVDRNVVVCAPLEKQ
jgi:hypothetical protein